MVMTFSIILNLLLVIFDTFHELSQMTDDVQNENDQKTADHKKENLNLLDQLIKEQAGLSKPEEFNQVRRGCSEIHAHS